MVDEICSSFCVPKEPLNPQILVETHLHQNPFSVSSRPIVCSSPQTPRVFPFLFNSRPLLCLIFPFLLCPKRTRKQNPSDTNFIILQNPSMFREIGKKHWNTNKSKTEHLNKNFEIQTLKFRGIQNRARWVYGGREREREKKNVVTWAEFGADELTVLAPVRDGLVAGAGSSLGWVILSIDVVTREIMRWTEPLEFDIKAGSQKKSRKWIYVGSERWVRWVNEEVGYE